MAVHKLETCGENFDLKLSSDKHKENKFGCEENSKNIINDQPIIPLINNPIIIQYPPLRLVRKISKADRYNIFNSDENLYIAYFEYVYCNDTLPKYQKLLYEDDKNVLVFIDNKWHSQNAWNILHMILEDEYKYMAFYAITTREQSRIDKIHNSIDLAYTDNLIKSMIDSLKKYKLARDRKFIESIINSDNNSSTKLGKEIKSKKISRYVSNTIKKNIMKKQKETCANSPKAILRFIGDFKCPRWEESNGSFILTNYKLNHIVELSTGGTNDESNLQYLCLDCHSVKTKNFISYVAEIKQAQIEYHACNNIIDTESI